MLSYQHAYHAGNLADLHKHALLARILTYLVQKPKPLSYLETHAGRALYDLDDPAARRTGEAEAGIIRAVKEGWLAADHPLIEALAGVRALHGDMAYPGSPLIARHFLRSDDRMHLAELHPAEAEALAEVMTGAQIHRQDGFAMANALCPPDPRRGLLLIDPSYEVKADYGTMPGFIRRISRKWGVGIILLWYPLLSDGRHRAMADEIAEPDGVLRHEVHFPALRPGHNMIGSGMIVINPTFGLSDEVARLDQIFATLRETGGGIA